MKFLESSVNSLFGGVVGLGGGTPGGPEERLSEPDEDIVAERKTLADERPLKAQYS